MMQNKSQAYDFLKSGNLTGAKKLLEKITRKTPNDAESLMMLGYVYSQQAEHNRAIQCLLKVSRINPEQDVAFYNLGNAYKAKGDFNLAIDAFKTAVKIKPGFDACINLGNTLSSVGRYNEAIKYLQQAISIKPDDAMAYYNLGRVLKTAGLLEESVEAYKKSVELNADFFAAYNNLGNAYLSIGHTERAGSCYERALQLEPESLDALSGKLRLLDKTREFDKALDIIHPHINKKTEHVGLCATFADFSHHLGKEEEAIDWLNSLLVSPNISAAEKSRLFFLLGKLLDKKQNYPSAFKAYQQANDLIKQNVNFSKLKSYFSTIKNIFTRDSLAQYARSSLASTRPVFIVGMPRSGTSLVEQIIASHPQVSGAGELETMSSLTQEAERMSRKGQAYPKVVRQLDTSDMDLLAKQYMQRLDKVSTESRFITDKMPHNFLHLGFIQMLFPECRIIHCRRNPLDTSLSCYFQDFSGNHPYSNDLSNLAEYYGLYTDLMDHWSANLSLPIFNVDYEQLVSDQENTSKKLLEFCQLDWHEDCLHFYKAQRSVATASYDQVRQKLYHHSVERWRNYEAYIQPLLKRLSAFV